MFIQYRIAQWFSRLNDQEGQGLLEYVLLVSLIAITLLGSLMSLKDIIYNILTSIPVLSS
ncbi:MAG: Flp family type IVb pilin [Caldilineaceae bacterium]